MNEYISWAVTHLGAWSLILLAAYGVGRMLLRRLPFDSLAERMAFTLVLGLGTWALLLFALGLVGLLYEGVMLGLTVAGALYALAQLAGLRRNVSRLNWQRWREVYSLRGVALVSLIGLLFGYWILLLVTTQYPPFHWDATSHHLPLAREFLAQHRIVALMGIPHPVMPALNHMLFAWGLALKDGVLAQMIEHTFLMLTAVGLYAWGRRQGRRLFGLALAAFWLANPLVLWLGESAYVDIALVCFTFLGVYALRRFWESGQAGWWLLGMTLLGMAAGVKLPGLFFVIVGSVLGLGVLMRRPIDSQPDATPAAKDELEPSRTGQPPFTYKSLAQGWALAALCLIPWYAHIFYHTGNPIWPTFPQWSRGIWGAPAMVENTNSWLKNAAEPRTIKNFLLLPLDWLRYPGRFYAESNLTLFPLIVVWPLSWLFAWGNRSIRWWTLWALSFTVYWFMFPHQLRYWLPALPLVTLALYESIRWAMERITRSARIQGTIWVALMLAALLYGSRAVWGEIKSKQWPPVNQEAQEHFVSRLSGYRAVKYLNKQLQDGDAVCMIGGSYLNYYLNAPVLDLFGLMQSGKLPRFSWPDDQPWQQWLESQNINWIFLNHANQQAALPIPQGNLVLQPFWPDYELVYADDATWVFRRKPVPPERL
ncbi:MAG: hypothetical protein V7641_461 [Blastocatellia bacterium]